MDTKHNLATHIGFGMLLGIGIVIAIFFPFIPDISNSSVEIFTSDTGVFFSYYAAIFGGFVGGVFTYAGVKLSLDKQEYLIKREAEAHKGMLLLQLKYSYSVLSNHYRNRKDSEKMPAIATVFDDNWYTHLPYIQCLDQDDLENIVDWFNSLQDIDDRALHSVDGGDSVKAAVESTDRTIEHIEAIIAKLKSDSSC